MNDIEFKNLAYRKNQVAGLPYSSEADISYSEGTVVNAARLNNTWCQLVDNDKAIVEKLADLSSAASGPRLYNPADPAAAEAMYNAPNGHKAWLSADGGLALLHKRDVDLRESVFMTGLSSRAVYGFAEAAGLTFAATDGGIYALDGDGNASLFTDISSSSGQVPSACRSVFNGVGVTMFATDAGVLQLNSVQRREDTPDGTVVSSRPVLFRRNRDDIGECRSVFVSDGGRMYVSTSRGLFAGDYRPGSLAEDLVFSQIELVGPGAPTVNGFTTLSPNRLITENDNDVLALTDAGVYQSESIESVNGKMRYAAGRRCNCAFEFGGSVYACTDDGLYSISGESVISPFPAYSFSLSGDYAFIGSAGKVFRVDMREARGGSPSFTAINLPVQGAPRVVSVQALSKSWLGVVFCTLETGETYTVDAGNLAVMGTGLPPARIAAFSGNDSLALADGASNAVSSYAVRGAVEIESDVLAPELAVVRPEDGVVGYVRKSAFDDALASKTKIRIRSAESASSEFTVAAEDLKSFEYAHGESGVYGVGIDGDRAFAVEAGTFAKSDYRPLAEAVTDTVKAVIWRNGSGLSAAGKADFSESATVRIPVELSPSASLASDGNVMYIHDRGELKAFSEAYYLNDRIADEEITRIASDGTGAALVAYGDRLQMFQLSAKNGSQAVLSCEIQTKVNDVGLVDSRRLFLASDSGLSVMQISADAAGRRGFGAVEKTLNGVPAVSYCEVQTADPYEFVASRADLSVLHDEYVDFSGFAATAGFSLCRSYGSDRNYYVVAGEDETVIFDGETAISSLDGTVNCAAYAATPSGGKALIAADGGLSAIDVLYDSGKDVSALGGVSLIAAGQFVAVKCQVAATALCAAYAATATDIYEISGDWTIGPSPAVSGFSSIRAVDGYCLGGRNALIVLDGDRLKACDPKTGAVSSYAALSGIDELAVAGDESDLAQLSGVGIVVRRGSSLYVVPAERLQSADAELGEPLASGVVSLQKDFALLPSKTGRGMALSRRSALYAYVWSGEGFFVDRAGYDAALGALTLTPMCQRLGFRPRFAGFTARRVAPEFIAGSDGVASLRRNSRAFTGVVCKNLDASVVGDRAKVRAISEDGLIEFSLAAGGRLEDIKGPDLVYPGATAHARIGETVSVIAGGALVQDASRPDAGVAVVRADSPEGPAAARSFAYSDKVLAASLGVRDDAIIFSYDGAAYAIGRNMSSIDARPVATFGGVDAVRQTDGEVYAKSGRSLSSVSAARLTREADFGADFEDFRVARRNGEKVFFVKTPDGGWSYSLPGGLFAGALQPAPAFAGHDVVQVCGDGSADGFSVAVRTGLCRIGFAKAAKLALDKSGEAAVGSGRVTAIAGSSVESDRFMVAVKGTDGVTAYGMKGGAVTPAPVLTRRGASAFAALGPANGDLASGEAYAVEAGKSFLMAPKSSSELSEYRDERIRNLSAEVLYVAKAGDAVYVCTDKGVLKSEGNGRSWQFNYVALSSVGFDSAVRQTELTSLLAGSNGLYTLANRGNPLSGSIYKNQADDAPAYGLTEWNFTGVSPVYAYCSGTSVLTAENGKTFGEMVRLPDGAVRAYSAFPTNRREFFFGTAAGAYKTEYSYSLSDDIARFTPSDVRRAYDAVEPELDAETADEVTAHVSAEHSAGALVSMLNRDFLPASPAAASLSGWVSAEVSAGWAAASNDVVSEIAFGDETAGDVTVSLSNFLTSDANAKCSYVIRRYASGLVEACVYLPTTNTYYINHIAGVPGCTNAGREIDRQNLSEFNVGPFAAGVSRHCSTFEIGIAAAALSIDTLLGVEAAGNSLPLKCYRDRRNPDADQDLALRWHSFAAPTEVVLTPDSANPEPSPEGEYRFKFACFGSDAQSVRITAFAPPVRAERFAVRFNANGAKGAMPPQKFVAGVAQRLRPCAYEWAGPDKREFAGWAAAATAKSAEYADGAEFSKSPGSVADGQVFDLYAVWA